MKQKHNGYIIGHHKFKVVFIAKHAKKDQSYDDEILDTSLFDPNWEISEKNTLLIISVIFQTQKFESIFICMTNNIKIKDPNSEYSSYSSTVRDILTSSRPMGVYKHC